MGTTKNATELAMRRKQDARYEVLYKPGAPLAPMFKRQAAELIQLPGKPAVGPGGEVIDAHPAPSWAHRELRPAEHKRLAIRETLAEGANRIAEDASIDRTSLLMQPSFNAVAMGIDAAESIGAQNSLEKMLAHQMAAAHEAAMRMLDRGLSFEHRTAEDQTEPCRCTNAAVRLMEASSRAALTIQRLRCGGSQTVTVQHVTVASGGQAVIGNVTPGGQASGGKSKNEEMPCNDG